MPYRAHRFLIAYLAAYIIGTAALGRALSAVNNMLGIDYSNLSIQMNILIEPLCLGVCLAGYALLVKKPDRPPLNLRLPSAAQAAVVVAIALVSAPFAGLIGAVSAMFFQDTATSYIDSFTRYPFALGVFAVCVIPAVCEETLMRGVVLSNYRGVNIAAAAVINGLFFGLFHMNFQQAAYAFALGIVLAYIVYYTGSLVASMLAHFTMNAFSVSLAYFMPARGAASKAAWSDVIAIGRPAAVSLFMIILLLRVLARMRSAVPESAAGAEGLGRKWLTPSFVVVVLLYAGVCVLFEVMGRA